MENPFLKKGLFSVTDTPEEKPIIASLHINKEDEKSSFNDYGFQQAGRLGGTSPGLRVCLQKIYQDFRQAVKDDNAKQEQLKKPYRVKMEQYKGENEKLEKKIEKLKSESIPKVQKNIAELKESISRIRKNPEEIIADSEGVASFYIGGVILGFLTIYLFIFYSSASYSAFFKEFSLNNIGVASSIFDPRAIPTAWAAGITELALILTIPFVFLGLGYLIHKFQKQKSLKKYFKIAMLILVTFLFDCILAFEITEKIYNIQSSNKFTSSPDYTVSFALQNVSFWLIIFAGFVVYMIWGFVFDFIMEAYAQLDKIRVAIQEREKEISASELELKNLESQIDTLATAVADNQTEINKLNKTLENHIVPQEFELDIFSFMAGWLAWMKQSGKKHDDLKEAEEITTAFVKITLQSFVITS